MTVSPCLDMATLSIGADLWSEISSISFPHTEHLLSGALSSTMYGESYTQYTFSLFISGIKGEVDIQYFPQICFVGNIILQDHFCHAHDSITEIRDVHVSFSGKIFVHWHSNISDLSFCTIE